MKYTINLSENDLETFLVDKIPQTWELKIIKRQFHIKGGIIDILAKDKETNSVYWVIEIKTGEITPDSVCQVLRYTQYMNSEMSKEGKRFFYPLLIGKSLSRDQSNGHLYKLLKVFDGYVDRAFYVFYSLYHIGIDGIELNWYDKDNEEFMTNSYDSCYNHYDDLENKYIDCKIRGEK